MKILVAYYSRTGNTKQIGDEIAKKLEADVDEIVDLKNRTRKIIGWIIAGKDASQEKTTDIKIKKNPKEYDLVIIGTPVWSWNMTPAIRTYLEDNKFNKVAFFCTCGGNKGKTFEEMEKMAQAPLATLELFDKIIKENKYKEDLESFCSKLKSIDNNPNKEG